MGKYKTQNAEEIDAFIFGMGKRLAQSALGKIPVAGFVMDAAFGQILSQLDNTLAKLREEISEEIDLAIRKSDTNEYEQYIDEAARRLKSYLDNARKQEKNKKDPKTNVEIEAATNFVDNALANLSEAFAGWDSYVLGKTTVSAKDRIPHFHLYTMMRMAVWQRIEDNPKTLQEIDVRSQVHRYLDDAGPLLQRLILEAVSIWEKEHIFKSQAVARYRLDGTSTGYWDGVRYGVYNASENKWVKQYDPMSAEDAHNAYWNFIADGIPKVREKLLETYSKPFKQLAALYNWDCVRIIRNGWLGASHSLQEQYIDARPVVCDPRWFVTGIELYKHHNTLAVRLGTREIKAGENEALDPWKNIDWLHDGTNSGASGKKHLAAQHLDLRPVICPPGQAIAGIRLKSIEIFGEECISFDISPCPINSNSPGSSWTHSKADPKISPELSQQYSDLKHVNRTDTHEIAVGCRFYRHHNQIALELILGTIQGVRANVDYRMQYESTFS